MRGGGRKTVEWNGMERNGIVEPLTFITINESCVSARSLAIQARGPYPKGMVARAASWCMSEESHRSGMNFDASSKFSSRTLDR